MKSQPLTNGMTPLIQLRRSWWTITTCLRQVIYWKGSTKSNVNLLLFRDLFRVKGHAFSILFRYSPGRVVLGMVGRVSAARPIHPEEFAMFAAHSSSRTSTHLVNFLDVWWCLFPFWRCLFYFPSNYFTKTAGPPRRSSEVSNRESALPGTGGGFGLDGVGIGSHQLHFWWLERWGTNLEGINSDAAYGGMTPAWEVDLGESHQHGRSSSSRGSYRDFVRWGSFDLLEAFGSWYIPCSLTNFGQRWRAQEVGSNQCWGICVLFGCFWGLPSIDDPMWAFLVNKNVLRPITP